MGTNFYWNEKEILGECAECRRALPGAATPELVAAATRATWLKYVAGTPPEHRYAPADEDSTHIGKRSAAGLYCWRCNVTLCKSGVEGIHRGHAGWHETCPVCGDVKQESDPHSSGLVELGYATPHETRPTTGVSSCSSFSWAQDPETVLQYCAQHPDRLVVRNEYGAEYTGQEFLDMLYAGCPIEYIDSIGIAFS